MQPLKIRGLALCLAAFLPGLIAGAHAQNPAASAPRWSYDVVSIKPNNSGDHRINLKINAGSISAENARIIDLLAQAYGIKSDLMSGLPGWADNGRYDITAKMTLEDSAEFMKAGADERTAGNKAMMQAMLADRFKLKAHVEIKELPVYELVIAKGGSKLTEIPAAAPDANAPRPPDGRTPGSVRMGMDSIDAQAVQVAAFASALGNRVHRKVIDKTGLTGTYDFALKFALDTDTMPALPPGFTPPPSSPDAPSIFTAVQEQLGLKLVSSKGPVETLVIDHIEEPALN